MSLFSSIVIWSEESFETIQALVESSTKLNKAINESRISVIRYNSILSTIFNNTENTIVQQWCENFTQKCKNQGFDFRAVRFDLTKPWQIISSSKEHLLSSTVNYMNDRVIFHDISFDDELAKFTVKKLFTIGWPTNDCLVLVKIPPDNAVHLAFCTSKQAYLEKGLLMFFSTDYETLDQYPITSLDDLCVLMSNVARRNGWGVKYLKYKPSKKSFYTRIDEFLKNNTGKGVKIKFRKFNFLPFSKWITGEIDEVREKTVKLRNLDKNLDFIYSTIIKNRITDVQIIKDWNYQMTNYDYLGEPTKWRTLISQSIPNIIVDKNLLDNTPITIIDADKARKQKIREIHKRENYFSNYEVLKNHQNDGFSEVIWAENVIKELINFISNLRTKPDVLVAYALLEMWRQNLIIHAFHSNSEIKAKSMIEDSEVAWKEMTTNLAILIDKHEYLYPNAKNAIRTAKRYQIELDKYIRVNIKIGNIAKLCCLLAELENSIASISQIIVQAKIADQNQ